MSQYDQHRPPNPRASGSGGLAAAEPFCPADPRDDEVTECAPPGRTAPAFAFLGLPAAILETERRNWFLWLPVALALGALTYFRLEFEPATIAAVLPLAIAVLLRKAAPDSTIAVVATGLILTFTLGFAAAKLRTEWVRAPVLASTPGPLEAIGIVELIEPKEQSGARVTLWLSALGDLNDDERPARIRVTLQQGSASLSPGDRIRLKVNLLPPPMPAAPGDYDFARHAWFKQLGAVGRAVGTPVIEPDGAAALSLGHRALSALARLRKAIGDRVTAALPGETGAIANALITGERTAISEATNEAFRASGLYHILSISGLHMAIMGGAVFFAIRFALALIPSLALRYPIKKWAAVGAIAGAGAYLMISGGAFATVRSFIMISVMFTAILLDRPALALRNVAIAAAFILLLFPESILDPGFQMSFAAVIALIAGYEGVARVTRFGTEGMRPGGMTMTVLLFLAGIVGSTLLASAAVAPFALYHFHQTQHYAVLANLIAIPACNLIVMPAALATLLAMPFGLEAVPLALMAFGIQLMSEAANFVADLPGAVGHHPSINENAFAVMIAGGLIWALVDHKVRWLGAAAVLAALAWSPLRMPPDILIGRSADVVAARTADGRLSALPARGIDYTLSRWLERDGDPRHAQQAITQAAHAKAPPIAPKPPERRAGPADGSASGTGTLPSGFWQCDALGCTITVSGMKLAVPRHPAAAAEDCTTADIVILRSDLDNAGLLQSCTGPRAIISAKDISEAGAHALTIRPRGATNDPGGSASEPSTGAPETRDLPEIHIETVAATRGSRPWAVRGATDTAD